MIKSISDLEKYTQKIAAKYPEEAEEIILKSPGISKEEEQIILKNIPQISAVYLNCAKRLDLIGVKLGYFFLWPAPRTEFNLSKTIIEANAEHNPFKKILKENGLVQVALWEADPIVVANADSKYGEDRVFKINTGSPKSNLQNLANNFEDFLIIIGNLDETAQTSEEHNEEEVNEFLEKVKYLIKDEDTLKTWQTIAEIVILE
jgi:hypothetical protein